MQYIWVKSHESALFLFYEVYLEEKSQESAQ